MIRTIRAYFFSRHLREKILIVALIFLVALSAITSFGTSMNTMYGVISTAIGGATH